MSCGAAVTDLARYLFFSARFSFGPGQVVACRAAAAIAPLYFVGGRFTGYPAHVSPTWLARRGVGGTSVVRGLEAKGSNAARGLKVLVDHGLLRREQRQGALRIAFVHHLERIEDWAWGPDELGDVSRDWEPMTDADKAWDGHDAVALALAPLVAAHAEVSWTPSDAKMQHLVRVGAELAKRYGLDTLHQAVRMACLDPDALIPLDALRFRDAFYALVKRARRAGES